MDASLFSRRAALTALVGLVAAPSLASARGAAPGKFSAIVVDVGPMRAKGDTITADWIASVLPGDLERTFAPYLAPGDRRAPVLHARIDLVELGVVGSAGSALGFSGAVDWIEGAAVVGGRDGAVYPLTSAVQAHPDLVDATGQEGRQRVNTLAEAFAQWLPGQMGLRG
jgi:hypothetical protein